MEKTERKIWVEFDGWEPVIKTYYKKGNVTKESYIGLFYWARRLRSKFYMYKLRKYFNKIGMPITTCQGCGEGVAEWRIKDPNKPTIFLKTCNLCTDFYDMWYSKTRLEILFRNNNEIFYSHNDKR